MLLGALVDAGARCRTVQAAIDAVIPDSVRLAVDTVTRAGLRATKLNVAGAGADPPHRTWRAIERTPAHRGPGGPGSRRRAGGVRPPGRGRGSRARRPAGSDPLPRGRRAGLDRRHRGRRAPRCTRLGDRAPRAPVRWRSAPAPYAPRHGEMPVPVPAVAELARGWRIQAGGAGELTTPTGMALLAALAECTELPALSVEAIGTGAGTRDTPGPAQRHPRAARFDALERATRTTSETRGRPRGQRRRPRSAAVARRPDPPARRRRRGRLVGADRDEEGPAGPHAERALPAGGRRGATRR